MVGVRVVAAVVAAFCGLLLVELKPVERNWEEALGVVAQHVRRKDATKGTPKDSEQYQLVMLKPRSP